MRECRKKAKTVEDEYCALKERPDYDTFLKFNNEIRNNVIGTIICTDAFLEATINEFFLRIYDIYNELSPTGNNVIGTIPTDIGNKLSSEWDKFYKVINYFLQILEYYMMCHILFATDLMYGESGIKTALEANNR